MTRFNYDSYKKLFQSPMEVPKQYRKEIDSILESAAIRGERWVDLSPSVEGDPPKLVETLAEDLVEDGFDVTLEEEDGEFSLWVEFVIMPKTD